MTEGQWREAWDILEKSQGLSPEALQDALKSSSLDPEVLLNLVAAAGNPESAAGSGEFHLSGITAGIRIGRYTVVRPLGRGGMGEVWAARDSSLDRMVALKFLPAGAIGRLAPERFLKEARAASALNHPNIVTIYEVVTYGPTPVIVMELIDGVALRERLSTRSAPPVVAHLGLQIAQALAAAHAAGIVHRDIKPENVMVRPDGYVKVLDFGLARNVSTEATSVSTGAFLGTLRYVSPEQVRGEPVQQPSDIFSLGLVLYELATGRHPFGNDLPLQTAFAISTKNPAPFPASEPQLPRQLQSLISAMLQKDAASRPPASDVVRTLAGVLHDSGAPQEPGGLALPGPSGARFGAQRYRRAAALAGAAVLLAAGFLWKAKDRIFSPSEPLLRQITMTPTANRVTTAAISSDGTKLAYAVFDGTLFVRILAENRALPVRPDFRIDRIAWWSDGSRLLVSGHAHDTQHPSIWIVPLNDAPAYLLRDNARDGSPSPDGTRVVFTQGERSEVWAVELSNPRPRKIVAGGKLDTFPVVLWSADSRHVIYQRRRYSPRQDPRVTDERLDMEKDYERAYESISIDTGRIAAPARNLSMTSACALPNGRILFLLPAKSKDLSYDVWEVQASPQGELLGSPQRITRRTDMWLSDISASDDGKHILVTRAQPGESGIRVGDLRQPGPQLVNIRTLSGGHDYPHAWTADSRAVIFESLRNGTFDLFKQEPGQYDPQTLVATEREEVLAQLSPDGKWVLYASAAKGGYAEDRRLFRVPVEGGQPVPVPIGKGILDEFRCAFPGGRRCVLRTTENRQFIFHELDPISGIGRELARTGWTAPTVGDWSLSPNGSEVAIPNHDDRERRIHFIALDPPATGDMERDMIVAGPGRLKGVSWAADGRGWFATLMSDEDLSRPSLDGNVRLVYIDSEGRSRVLGEFSFSTWGVPSPDGRRLAFVESHLYRNAWMFDRT